MGVVTAICCMSAVARGSTLPQGIALPPLPAPRPRIFGKTSPSLSESLRGIARFLVTQSLDMIRLLRVQVMHTPGQGFAFLGVELDVPVGQVGSHWGARLDVPGGQIGRPWGSGWTSLWVRLDVPVGQVGHPWGSGWIVPGGRVGRSRGSGWTFLGGRLEVPGVRLDVLGGSGWTFLGGRVGHPWGSDVNQQRVGSSRILHHDRLRAVHPAHIAPRRILPARACGSALRRTLPTHQWEAFLRELGLIQ